MGRGMSESAEYQSQAAPLTGDKAPALAHLHDVAREMRAKLDECLQHQHHPEVEAVHQLRTGTRRVEASLETLAREAGSRGLGQAIEEARQRWLKQLKKVRKAAGEVRDLDVHRELLADNILPEKPDSSKPSAHLEEASATASAQGDALVAQGNLLDRWLAAQRDNAAQGLTATLEGHARRLHEAEQRFFAACSRRRSLAGKHRPAARLALEDYLRLMDAMPHLDAGNLHDFRKGAKKARYVAESDSEDKQAQAMAKAIKRVQDAIGDWHDWLMLSDECGESLGEEGSVLQAELQRRVSKAYDRALRLTTTMGRRFVGEWQALKQTRRRPVQRPRAAEPQQRPA